MPAGKNICNCPTPPGGQAVCSENQLAICRVVNGIASTACLNAPKAFAPGSPAFNNWVLSAVLGTNRFAFAPVTDDEQTILSSGFYEVPGTDDIVQFKLPVSKKRDSDKSRDNALEA